MHLFLMVALPVKIRGRIQEIIPAALFMTTKIPDDVDIDIDVDDAPTE